MITRKPEDVSVHKNPHGVEAKKMYDYPSAIIIHLTLKPGESLIKHLTPTDVAFFVLEGKGIVQIGEERKEVDANTLIESPANVLHCWSNESKENLRVLVVKAPKPTQPSKYLEEPRQ
ncbi:MAG: cupin domain-containing protein [Candidatus Heimdallarchaeota archaeon]|nr:cupin domain-containing protein [Candidatus Heimdallarchaeota archaeon]MBY8993365.1 cupin domain-containing protein [Candidatus Heimdallarchaeota archaeon]